MESSLWHPTSLGPDNGGPLFFAHYLSGDQPNGLSMRMQLLDTGYGACRINYLYCCQQSRQYMAKLCLLGTYGKPMTEWYSAHAPGNDDGVISPTAALAPFLICRPIHERLRFFITSWATRSGEIGFADAFNLTNLV